MKKKILSFLLAVVMIAGMLPLWVIPAAAASGWQSYEVHGQYGYVKSGDEYYPLNSSSDFNSAFASGKTSYDIVLLSDYTADSLVLDSECLNIYLNGHNLTVTGDVEVDVDAGEDAKDTTIFAVYGNGGSITFPNSTSTSAFTFGWSGYMGNSAHTSFFDVTFLNCKGRVLDAESSGKLILGITNCRFENCSADYGSCLYLNNGLDTGAKIANCRFVNCSATDGGAVYVDDVGDEYSYVTFSDSYAVNCHASGDGGFMYVNDKDVKVYGSSNTVISDCSAGDRGGAVYMELGKTLDGFIFADNRAENGDGGAVCNKSNSNTISNCRFYRNYAKVDGGGIYLDNGTVENCKFFENDCGEDGYSLCAYWNATQIKNCSFRSSYGSNVVYNGTQTDCVFPETNSYSLSGDGSQNNPYVIKNTDDWDAMYYMVKNHSRTEYSDGRLIEFGTDAFQGKYVRLDTDITVCNAIGETFINNSMGYTSKYEFTGTFDGNGHTVTYINHSDSGEKAAFGLANGATVKNLTVNGYIRGSYSLGGIFGNAWNCTAENCVNNAEIHNTALYTGGIAGYSAYSNFINCTNNGKIEGLQSQVGGIAGYAEGDTFNGCTNNGEVITGNQMAGGIVGNVTGNAKGNVSILNCINNGTVTATYCYGGGIVGYEDGKVTAANCINTGKINAAEPSGQYPAEGDYVIHSANDTNYCFDISGESMAENGNLNMWNAQNSKAKVFTLKYSDTYGAYYIIAKHSGLALTAEPQKDYSTVDWVNVYQFTAQGLGYQLWNFEASGSSYKIRGVESGFTLNIAGGTASNGANVIAYKFGGNDIFNLVAQPNQTLKPVYANGITGKHHAGSTYEQCFYDKEKAIGDRYGIGLSTNALKGISADENGNLMPYSVNDYIKENNKSQDGWRYAAFDKNDSITFVSDAAAMYTGTDGLLHYVENAIQVTGSMETLGAKGKSSAYYVDGNVTTNGRIQILGNVTLILNDDCHYNVQGGIGLEKGNSLTVASCSLGEKMGKLTATANQNGAAAIGGNAANTEETLTEGELSVSSEKHDCGNFTVYGGNIEAIAYGDGVGIGGSSLSMRHSYTDSYVYNPIIFKTGDETFNGGDGGNVKVYNGNLTVKATGAVGIGGGRGAYFYVEFQRIVKTDKNFKGGCGGTFSFYGGTVTVESDLAAFGKDRNGGGDRDDVTDPNMTTFIFPEDSVNGVAVGDTLAGMNVIYALNEAPNLNGEKCVKFGDWRQTAVPALEPTCETAGHKAYVLRTADNCYYEDTFFTKSIGDSSALQAWLSEGGAGYLAPLGHDWVYDNEQQHKCARCETTDTHNEINGVCEVCGDVLCCNYYDYSVESNMFEEKNLTGGIKLLPAFDETYTLPGGWYLVRGDVTAPERITFTGDVHLILENGCNFTATNGIALSSGVSLTVYAQSLDTEEMGRLTVPYDSGFCAGIGSNRYVTCGSISIHGGIITVTSGSYAAGIGSGSQGSCGDISVYGGDITATGGEEAAGIGSGADGSCESVAISDYLDITAGADKDSAKSVDAYNGEKYVRLTEPSTAAKEPTCTQNGHIEFYKKDGKNYSDKACTKEITDLSAWLNTTVENGGGMIPATGHTWEAFDTTMHKCSVCKVEENHTDDGTGKCSVCGGEIFTENTFDGNGTKESPYLIKSFVDLTKLQRFVSGGLGFEGICFKLTADIETPLTQSIGGAKTFNGSFDGDGHTVTLKVQGENNVGLFGATENATIKNVIVKGTVSGTGNAVGGIVGYAGNGTVILNCINTANITGFKYVGGIVGDTVADESKTVLIENCINYGDITALTGGENAGGIAGHMAHCGTLINCFTSGAVSNEGNSGIIVGWANRNFSIENSYYQTLDANSGMVAVKHDNGKTYSATAVSTADNADMIEAMNEKADGNDGWYYWTVEDGRAWLTSEKPTESVLTVQKKDASCTEAGWAQYYKKGDTLYENAECTKEIPNLTEWSGYIPAKGHTWESFSDYEHRCTECYELEEHTAGDDYICTDCGHGIVHLAKADAIKAIKEAAGDSTDMFVTALVNAAVAEINKEATDTVAKVIEIKNKGIAAIEKQLGGTSTHTHTFADTYTHNDTHHWRVCTCEDEKCNNLVDGFAVHTFTVVTNDDGSKTYTCACGYTKVVYDKPDDEGEVIGGTTYTGISLTLGSDISINFYMELSDDARQNGTMTFNIGGRIVTLKGTDAKYNSTEKKYYFSTPLTVLEMAETVTTTFTYNGVDYVQEYSVEQYIDAILNGKDKDGKDYSDEMKLLARKIANYGYYAQIYLESIHTNVHIVDPYTEPEKGYDRVEPFGGEFDINTQKAIEALKDYKASVSGTSDNLSLYGSTVYFDAATALNYYVTVKNGEEPTATAVNTVTGEEKQVEIKLYKGNIYIVSVKDITATELADDITVTINDEIALTGSVFAYCNSVVSAHSFDGATEKDTFAVNAMAAFYEYYEAACDYANRKIFKDGYLYFTCDAPDMKKVRLNLQGVDGEKELTFVGDGIFSDDGYVFDEIRYADGYVAFTVIGDASQTVIPYLKFSFDKSDCAPMIIKINGLTDGNVTCEIKKLK